MNFILPYFILYFIYFLIRAVPTFMKTKVKLKKMKE